VCSITHIPRDNTLCLNTQHLLQYTTPMPRCLQCINHQREEAKWTHHNTDRRPRDQQMEQSLPQLIRLLQGLRQLHCMQKIPERAPRVTILTGCNGRKVGLRGSLGLLKTRLGVMEYKRLFIAKKRKTCAIRNRHND